MSFLLKRHNNCAIKANITRKTIRLMKLFTEAAKEAFPSRGTEKTLSDTFHYCKSAQDLPTHLQSVEDFAAWLAVNPTRFDIERDFFIENIGNEGSVASQ